MGFNAVWPSLSAWWQAAVDLVLPQPPVCALCREEAMPPPLCAGCLASMRFPAGVAVCGTCSRPLFGHLPGRPALCLECARGEFRPDGAAALGLLDGGLQQAVHKLKFHDRSDLAHPLGQALAVAAGALPRASVLVPVPLHRQRLAERGYNQAALLARAMAPALGAPVQPLLQRRRPTAAQSALGRSARLANLSGAFVATLPLAGKSVLLVDDVLTTGATANAATAALRAAGAAAVCLAVLAVSTTPVPATSAR